ncbi:kinase-like domain-containing protein [Blyttiomyces helicus]|uniref:non-specific serine/threonine protein kinase n=1 Tax=Blyttiomyces helicus TaxID=388810 RepID=A0A4P9VYL2_9FUNG|nr:kinase-like domain-containing protein [Blyttiomyces helicus]|eukprot:RKO84844.1 kinase-like domain-containing protein [Blyttiomyces helicus]
MPEPSMSPSSASTPPPLSSSCSSEKWNDRSESIYTVITSCASPFYSTALCSPQRAPCPRTEPEEYDIAQRARIAVSKVLCRRFCLTDEYEVRELLGWGGNGAVIGAVPRADARRVGVKLIYRKAAAGADPAYYLVIGYLGDPIVDDYNWDDDVGEFLCSVPADPVAGEELRPARIVSRGGGKHAPHLPVAKLCDFGHAKQIGWSSSEPPALAYYGTPETTPPELLPNLGLQSATAPSEVVRVSGFKADVWAIGLLLYAMVMGTPAVNGRAGIDVGEFETLPCRFRDDVEMGCWDLVERMLTVDPEKRISAWDILRYPWFRSPNWLAFLV